MPTISKTDRFNSMQQVGLVVALTVFAVLGRLLIDTPNFKPTMAVALISGSLFKDWRYAVAAPLFSMLLTDFWLGGYEWPLMLAVYACMLAPVAWSRWIQPLFGQGVLGLWSGWNAGAVSAALLFFLVTNFACWMATPWYPQTWAGLSTCYFNAVPFLRWMVMGNLLFVNLLAAVWAICSWVSEAQRQAGSKAELFVS